MKAILRSGFLALAVILALAVPVNAGPFEDGVAAYNRGNYATALEIWRPIAERGVTQAQFNFASCTLTAKACRRIMPKW